MKKNVSTLLFKEETMTYKEYILQSTIKENISSENAL